MSYYTRVLCPGCGVLLGWCTCPGGAAEYVKALSNEQNSMELRSFTTTTETNPRIFKGLSHNGAPGGYNADRPLITDA